MTLGAIVAAAARDDHALDRSLADQARFAFAAVNPVLQLKESLFAVRVHIVGDRRPTQGDGLPKYFLDRGIEASQVVARE